MSVFLAIFTSVLFSAIKYAHFSGLGKCPNHGYMDNFDITRFTGQWYEIERSFYLMELLSSCILIHFKENDYGQYEATVKTIDFIGRMSIKRTLSEGIVEQSSTDPSLFVYKVSSSLPNSLSNALPGAGTYQILDTDYDNYAIIWKCSNYLLTYIDHVWIYGRRKEINATLRAKIYKFLQSKKIDSERLVIPRNNNCTQ